ncbi:hypothetical protein [[Eubacterium] cellulosolvens]
MVENTIFVYMKKLPTGTGWLIGILTGICIIVLCNFFLEDGLATGIIVGPTAAWTIGFPIEGQKKKLTDKEEKRIKPMITVAIILLVILFLLGIIFYLQ